MTVWGELTLHVTEGWVISCTVTDWLQVEVQPLVLVTVSPRVKELLQLAPAVTVTVWVLPPEEMTPFPVILHA